MPIKRETVISPTIAGGLMQMHNLRARRRGADDWTENSQYAGYSMVADFAKQRYAAKNGMTGLLEPDAFSDLFQFSRTGQGETILDGNVRAMAPANTPRFLEGEGIVLEIAETNLLPNPEGNGAVAGNPGTFPTAWNGLSLSGSLATQIVSTRVENGRQIIRVRVTGTPGVTNSEMMFSSLTALAALSGQTWTGGFMVAHVAGTLTNIANVRAHIQERNAAGVFLVETAVNFTPTATLTRVNATRTFNNASTARATVSFQLAFTNTSTPVDVTFDISSPAISQRASFGSYLPDNNARGQDLLNMILGADWWTKERGCFVIRGTIYNDIVGANRRVLCLGGTSSMPEIQVGRALGLYDGNGGNANTGGQRVTVGTPFTAKVAWAADKKMRVCLDNGTVITSGAFIPTTINAATLAYIGRQQDNAAAVDRLTLQSIGFIPNTDFTDAQLSALNAII